MRKLYIAAASIVLLAGPAAAADQYGGFQQYADRGSMKPFCRDLGGILGSATFHGGRALGFSGFDAGLRGGMLFSPDRNDQILRRKGVKAFGVPWVQAEIGMPFKIDGFIRGISYQGLTIAGGGLRYGLWNASDAPWSAQLMISGVGHSVVHQHFSASHLGASLVYSMGIPAFTPYVGAGVDRTRVVARSSVADPTINGESFSTVASRFTLGMRLRPWPFFYLTLAGILSHGRPGGEAGLGIRF